MLLVRRTSASQISWQPLRWIIFILQCISQPPVHPSFSWAIKLIAPGLGSIPFFQSIQIPITFNSNSNSFGGVPEKLSWFLRHLSDGLNYSIKIRQISHRTFGPSHRKCPTCPMIFVNTALGWKIAIPIPFYQFQFLFINSLLKPN